MSRAAGFPSEPWGSHRASLPQRLAIGAARALAFPVLKQLGLGIRHVVRPGLKHVDTRLWGHRLRMTAHGNLAEGRLLFLPRAWDRRERQAIRRFLRPGATFVDVGANAGGYTWWVLSLLGGDCRVVAVEPDPYLSASLRFNMATNGLTNVTILPVAVGGDAGTGVLRIDPNNRGENQLGAVRAGGRAQEGVGVDAAGGARTVEVRRLGPLLEHAGVGAVDLMKVDIEGLELEVLTDFFDSTPPVRWPAMLITERKQTAAHDALERLLTGHGYTVTLRTGRNIVCRRSTADSAG